MLRLFRSSMREPALKAASALLAVILLAALLAACSSAPSKKTRYGRDGGPGKPVDVSQVPDAVPKEEPLARYGNKSPYTVLGKTYWVLASSKGFTQTGTASWYGTKFHGMKTSSGELYDMYKMTAAHRNLPLPTYARVTNLSNGKSVIVKVNDRGPFHSERVMDLSYAAAARLDIIRTGTATVRIEAIDPAHFKRKNSQADATPVPEKTDGNIASDNIGNNTSNSASDDAPHFYVQVGAFGAINNATALQARLLDLIYAPVTIARDNGKESSGNENNSSSNESSGTESSGNGSDGSDGSDGSGINRVRVGPFFTREDAEKVSRIIHDNDLGNPLIVQK